MTECPAYGNLSEKFIFKNNANKTDPPLKYLLQNQNMLITRDVGVFICYGVELREKQFFYIQNYGIRQLELLIFVYFFLLLFVVVICPKFKRACTL